ncbi:hypothetical protein [Gloeobacter violaceus]|uniref:hypothetical protein n=1 Tax=Gloeobacter violaceus TaxID=33072 RepID=UPI0002D8901B|nr:hypothetical protein [Gloeobacter violaceus]
MGQTYAPAGVPGLQLLSGSTPSVLAARSRSAGFQAHLSKPMDMEQLVESVARLVGRTTV